MWFVLLFVRALTWAGQRRRVEHSRFDFFAEQRVCEAQGSHQLHEDAWTVIALPRSRSLV
jgi:hypothetical protein